jgi:hypothetical protein
MRQRKGRGILSIAVGSALLLSLLGGGAAWGRTTKKGGQGLWIVADRIVGFVPFTVSVYGRILGSDPGQVELCRSETAWITQSSPGRLTGGRATVADAASDDDTPCTAGQIVRTPEGYDYSHDLHFDRPGVYHVQLMMVDPNGRRIGSNTLQVNAF